MDQKKLKRRARNLRWMLELAGIYVGLMVITPTLTGNTSIDGGISVLLGLYICSHPAANMVDTIFFGRENFAHLAAENASTSWIALNAIALIAGWGIIAIGITHLVS